MKINFLGSFLILVCLYLMSCTSHDLACAETVEFQTAFNIMQADCTISGCHGDDPAIPDWKDENTVKSKATKIAEVLNAHRMPPAGSGSDLNEEERQRIICWANQNPN